MNSSDEHLDLVSDPFDEAGKAPTEEAPTLDLLRAELDEAKDRALRARAELENYRARANRLMEEERKYASIDLMRDLLAVGDNIFRALEAAEKAHELEPLIEGVKLVYDQFYQVLQKYHCERIPALHEPFDPNFHESIAMLPSEEYAPNTVIEETRSGFRLYDRVVRPSQVVLAAPK